MAFNNLGNFFLGAGQSGRYWVSRGSSHMTGGQNYGAQIVEADPHNDGVPGNLQVSGFAKQVAYNEYYSSNGLGDTNTAYWLYWVTVTNIGSTGKWFSLQGGGLS